MIEVFQFFKKRGAQRRVLDGNSDSIVNFVLITKNSSRYNMILHTDFPEV